jgi:WXG100 family type VII secretion target
MTQILYNYPAMLATVGEMQSYTAQMQSIGSEIGSQQGVLASTWAGDTGMSFQAWQTQWNSCLEQLIQAYQQMTSAHENNTMSMLGRDQGEGAKWM